MPAPSTRARQILGDMAQHRGSPGLVQGYLVDELLNLVNPSFERYSKAGNCVHFIGGQGIVIKALDEKKDPIALKLAHAPAGPAGPARLVFSHLGIGGSRNYEQVENIPDRRFVESAKLQQAIADDREIVDFIIPRVRYIDLHPTPYFVMEWVEHCMILQYLDDVRDIRTALKLFMKVLNIAHILHQRGIVYRDFKSQNLGFAAQGKIALFDFGLARIVDPRDLTVAGSPLGTAPYASPKLSGGSASQASMLDDIYALGYVFAEFVTRRVCPPTELASHRKWNITDILGYRGKVQNVLPEKFHPVFLKATEPIEKERFQDAEEFYWHIEELLKSITGSEAIAYMGLENIGDGPAPELKVQVIAKREEIDPAAATVVSNPPSGVEDSKIEESPQPLKREDVGKLKAKWEALFDQSVSKKSRIDELGDRVLKYDCCNEKLEICRLCRKKTGPCKIFALSILRILKNLE